MITFPHDYFRCSPIQGDRPFLTGMLERIWDPIAQPYPHPANRGGFLKGKIPRVYRRSVRLFVAEGGMLCLQEIFLGGML
jgi:hypothetical protein